VIGNEKIVTKSKDRAFLLLVINEILTTDRLELLIFVQLEKACVPFAVLNAPSIPHFVPFVMRKSNNSFPKLCPDQGHSIFLIVAMCMESLSAELMLRGPIEKLELFWSVDLRNHELEFLEDVLRPIENH
jgi:hypothetical protein